LILFFTNLNWGRQGRCNQIGFMKSADAWPPWTNTSHCISKCLYRLC